VELRHIAVEDGPNGLRTLVLNRPDRLNAFDERMTAELEWALLGLAKDSSVRAVRLTGAGSAFCAGADQKRDIEAEGKEAYFEGDMPANLQRRLNRCVALLAGLAVPTIATVRGAAVGVGFNLVLACDLRIAAESGRFGQVYSRIGLCIDGGGSYFLPRLVGVAKALELTLLGEIFNAAKAQELGLLTRLVSDDDFEAEAAAFVAALAAGPTVALSSSKRAILDGASSSLDAALRAEEEFQARVYQTFDKAEGRAAFLEKRPPKFEGR